jgi:hypothetical protein
MASHPRLFEAVGDAALGQIVRRHLDKHLVAGQHADTVLAHPARGVRDDLMLVFELDPKVAFGSSSVTTPGNSRTSSFAIQCLSFSLKGGAKRAGPKFGRNLHKDARFVNTIDSSRSGAPGQPLPDEIRSLSMSRTSR